MNTTTTPMETTNVDASWNHLFEASQVTGGIPDAALGEARQKAFGRFLESGFPTIQDEDWRFTNLASFTGLGVHAASGGPGSLAALPKVPGRIEGSYQVVFLDGQILNEWSELPNLDGVRVVPLLEAGAKRDWPSEFRRMNSRHEDAFTRLNQALFSSGLLIELGREAVLDRPLHLIYLSSANQPGGTATVMNWIRAGVHSEGTLVESFITLGRAAAVTQVLNDFRLEAGAQFEHCKIQDENPSSYHFSTLFADLGADSRFRSHSFALGARCSRHTIRAALNGSGLEAVLNGLYLTRGEQLADHHMVVEHAQPHCESHEYFNGILDDTSRGVFHGRILVKPGAQKTDAKQTNKNLLLSDEAIANTKPQLEIYADDVKCTHGATIGQLNPESIFYLRSRGMDTQQARRMLMHAFAGEIVERVQHDVLREAINELVWDRLEQGTHLHEIASQEA